MRIISREKNGEGAPIDLSPPSGVNFRKDSIECFDDDCGRKAPCDVLRARMRVSDEEFPVIGRDRIGHVNKDFPNKVFASRLEGGGPAAKGSSKKITSDPGTRVALGR